jgi:O-antigen ligase
MNTATAALPRRQSVSRRAGRLRLAVYASLALCAWATLAFGAVYPWAYWPLMAGTACVAAALLCDAPIRAAVAAQPLLPPLAAVFAVIAFQLVPLPPRLLQAVSPATAQFLRDYVVGFSAVPSAHPLAIEPAATTVALAIGGALAALVLTMSAVMGEIGARRLVVGLVALGFAIALVGIIQRPMFDGKIYGFWEPIHRNNSFGPFVNPNHFAGWMSMCLSLTLGFMSGRFATALQDRARQWRDYIAWASGPEANSLFLLMMAAATMGLALVLALSRSGFACFAVAVLITAAVTIRKQQGIRRGLTVAYLLVVAVAAFAWVGPAAIQGQFGTNLKHFGLAGRVDHWRDAMSVVRAFPVSGVGVNGFGTAMVLYQGDTRSTHLTAAHNDYLQLLAEGGILLLVPVAWALFALAREIRRRFRDPHGDETTYWIRVGAVTGLIAIALQSIVEFSLQIPANAMLFACLCGIAIHRAPEIARRRVA